MELNTASTDKSDGLHSRRLTLDHAEIHYRTCGEGPAIVLIPSLGRGTEDFDRLLPSLIQAGLRLILPEPRGIEGSTPLREDETLHHMAADIGAVIEAESAAPAVLVGHAAGNWVARVLAHDRPDLTRAVAMLAAIVTNTVPETVKSSISASFDMSLPEAERLGHLRRVYFARGPTPRSGWRDGGLKSRRSNGARRGKPWIRTGFAPPTGTRCSTSLRPRMSSLHRPSLACCAKQLATRPIASSSKALDMRSCPSSPRRLRRPWCTGSPDWGRSALVRFWVTGVDAVIHSPGQFRRPLPAAPANACVCSIWCLVLMWR